MKSIWNTSNFQEYVIQINNTSVSVRTHAVGLKLCSFPQSDCIQNKVTIWFDPWISSTCIKKIEDAFAFGTAIMPQPISDAYDYLGIAQKNTEHHINKYVLYDDMVYAHYAFPSDDFYLIYDTKQKDIYLWGSKVNLERILISILSMTGDVLPFHAACICYHNKGYMIMGDTGSGKTAFALEMLKRGACYIADDILYLTKDLRAIRCNTYLSMRSLYVEDKMTAAAESIKADKTFLNVEKLCSQNGWSLGSSTSIDEIILISPLIADTAACTKLFCTFRHDSMFALAYLGGSIKEKLDASMLFWQQMRQKLPVKEIAIDYQSFKDSVKLLCDCIIA